MIKGGRKELKKRKIEATFRRVFAIALALIMMLSTVELSSIRAFATENSEEIATEEVEESVLEEIPESEDAQENDSEVPEDSASEEPEDVEFAETEEIVSEETDESKSETESSETVIDITVENKEEKALPYLGEISEGEMYGRVLVIDGHDMESAGMEYTTENLIAIFRAQTVKFNRIVVNDFFDHLGTVIPMEVWNEALLLIEENEDYYWNLRIGGTNDGDYYNSYWNFFDPQFTEEDIVLSLEVYPAKDNDNFIVFLDENDYTGLSSVEISFDDESEFYKWAEFELERSDEFGLFADGIYVTHASVVDYESSISLFLTLNDNMTSDKEYTLKTIDNSFGIITEYSDGTTGIDIYADDDGKDTIDLERLGEIVSYWSAKNVKFEWIIISHFDLEPSLIKKDIFNLLFEILSEDGRISFSYNNYGDGNEDEYNVKCWDFNNPVKMESDFQGKVEFRINESGKPEVLFSENSYECNDTSFYMNISEKNDFCQEFLLPKFGEPDYFDGSVSNNILLYENDDSYNCDALIRYLYNEGQIYLFFDNVEAISKDIANVMYRCSTENKGYIDMIGMTEFSLDEEGATNISYDFFEGDATMQSPDENGNVKIMATAPYSIVKVICRYKTASGMFAAKIMEFITIKGATSMKFVDSEIEHDWNGSDNDEYYMRINALPASEYVHSTDCIWEIVSGNSIELIENPDYLDGPVYDGTYRIVGYGDTVVRASYASATATCVIRVLPMVELPETPNVYALPQIHRTLADIDLNTLAKECNNEAFEGTFSWRYPETKLENHSGFFFAQALYTVEGRKPVYTKVPVNIVLIEGVEICIYDNTQPPEQAYIPVPASVKKDEKFVICAELLLGDNTDSDMIHAVKNHVKEGKIQIKWTDKEKGDLLSGEVISEQAIFALRNYTAATKGKKNLQVSVMNTATKKAIVTGKANFIVTENELFSFEKEVFELKDNNPEEMKGTVSIKISPENYKCAKKLTFKSEDTSLLKLGKVKTVTTDEWVTITIPYEFKKAGKTTLTVISSDELKTAKGFGMERIDYLPKLDFSTLTFDKASFEADEIPYGGISVICHPDVSFADRITIKEKTHADKILIQKMEFPYEGFRVSLANRLVKNGTYNLTLQSSYRVKDGEEKTFETKLKIIVKETKLKFSIKQNNVINEFYKEYYHNEDMIDFTIKPSIGRVNTLEMAEQNSLFDIIYYDTNKYYLRLKDGFTWDKLTPEQKKITFKYSVTADGEVYYGQTSFTAKTVNKAPEVEVFNTQRNHVSEMYTLYDLVKVSCTPFFPEEEWVHVLDNHVQLIDTKTGEAFDLPTYQDEKKKKIKVGKNDYYIYTDGSSINYELAAPYIAEKSTDVFTFRISNDNWKGTVDITIKNKVSNSKAKVKVFQKTVTLNANEDVSPVSYKYLFYEIANCETPYYPGLEDIKITGLDKKSKKALEKNLCISVESKMVEIGVYDRGDKKDDTYLNPGTYKYRVDAKMGYGEVSFTFQVKVVDLAPEKMIKVSQKGSINVLDRENTYVELSIKTADSFVSWSPDNFYLQGPDASLFDYKYSSYYGTCKVYAKEGVRLSTKAKYQVIPVCVYSGVEIEGAPVTIRVKQSGLKLFHINTDMPLYVNRGNETVIRPYALVNNYWKDILKVELINYTDDLIYEDYVLRFRTDKEPTSIKKAQGTYTLKFAVTIEGAAIDKEPLIITKKVKIVR